MHFLTIAVTALAAIPCGLAIPDGKLSKLAPTNKNTNTNIQSVGKANSLDRTGFSTAKTNDLLAKTNELAANVKANNKKTKAINTETVRPELKAEFLCELLEALADEIDKIYTLVKKLDCGCESSDRWEKIRDDLYLIELYLNVVNNYYIDPSDLSKCFECREESKIACCYRRYAESLIALLELIADKIEYLDGDTAYYIVTAINSLRDAEYAFTNEILRRLQCEESIREIVKKEGALEGSTYGSIREAFALFVSTPYITGEELKTERHDQHGHGQGHGHGHGHHEGPSAQDLEVVEGIKHKNKQHGLGHRPCNQQCPKSKSKKVVKAADAVAL